MSTTTTVNPLAPNDAITAARSVADLAVAMSASPALKAAILAAAGQLLAGGGKALLTSKSFWAALVTPVITFVVTYYGFNLDGATVGALTTLATSGMAILMRIVTKTPISGVVSAAPAA